jgi:GAF domain-containing protein
MTGERWGRLGLPVRSVIVAPVEQAGRFLGLIELVNPRDGGVFTDGDGNGLTYLGEQFAEFLAARGVVLDPERIEKG